MNSVNEIKELMPRVPRSISRVMPPVWRSRWKRRLMACKWRNTCRLMLRAVPSVALEKISSRSSVNSDVVSRSDAREVAAAWAPYCSVATWYIWRSLDPVPVAY